MLTSSCPEGRNASPAAAPTSRGDCDRDKLTDQAGRLYDGERAPRLLQAAHEGLWKVELRPHLAFWLSRPGERLYLHPVAAHIAEEYVNRWAGTDGANAERVGASSR